MRIASSSELQRGGASPDPDADAIYFERFGIAVVGGDPERLRSFVAAGSEERSILGQRPERIFRALGMEMDSGARISSLDRTDLPVAGSRDYLAGYLQGVSGLVGHLLGGVAPATGGLVPGPVPPAATALPDESAYTWGLQATRTPASKFTGRAIKVAILDTGLDTGHKDFVGRVAGEASFTGELVLDIAGHGTHCAGTACGPAGPSGSPRYGIACDADLYIGKVLSNTGLGSDRTVIAGLAWALDNGCDVISMSLGAATEGDDPFLEEYELIGVDALRNKSLIIAASGNESRRPGLVAPVGSPANCPSIMAVAAVDPQMRVAPFSCAGRSARPGGNIDISGPGVDIYSSFCRPREYARLQGTSMATPHVAGIAALYAEIDASYRGLALWGALMRGRRTIPGDMSDIGIGLVQAP
ncbi:protease [Methylobacterium terrae]|uniref:Protease n=2 Tax=Methylobacterium terrae TaxID=2202827 RepID=A0A2U8WY60_9HYPH|nr:protease [Methylobacterium terrae]